MNLSPIVLLLATVGAPEEGEPPPAGALSMLADALTWAFVVGCLVIIGWILWKFLDGWQGLSGSTEAEESRFEAELLSSAYVAKEGSAPPLAPPPGDGDAPEGGTPAPVPAAPDGEGGGQEAMEAFRAKLEQLRVIGAVEGRVALAVPPEALICRLTKGGSCLLLPRMETAEAMDHFLRRFGTVIYPGRGGDPVIVQRVTDNLKDLSGF